MDEAPVLSLKAQWTLIQHILKRQSDCMNLDTTSSWINSVDHRLLVTALTKQTAELELLQSEVEHAEIPNDAELANYDAACISPPQSPNIGYPSHSESRSPITPLSPDFGPRRGSDFSGTITRRRSSGLPPHTPPQSLGLLEGAANGTSNKSKLVRRDQERRIQWEAAWYWIERRLEYYINKFAEKHPNSVNGNEEIWAMLVEARMKCAVLGERMRKHSVASPMRSTFC